METHVKKGRIAYGTLGNTVTNKVWHLCDKLKKDHHVEVSCSSDEVSAVRSAVYRYRKESGDPIFCTLRRAHGKKYSGIIQFEDGE